jgi:hypothetical protein
MCDIPSTVFFFFFFLVENVLEASLILFPDIFQAFSYNSNGPNDYWYDKAFHIPHLLNF